VGTTANTNLDRFCRQVEKRSREHEQAMPVLAGHGWWSVAVGTLRQEVDSLIRVIFLLRQPQGLRDEIIESSLANDGRFLLPNTKGKLTKVADATMIGATDGLAGLDGWLRRVYDFGCAFIHLSSAHDYLANDPFEALPLDERQIIAEYLRNYHQGTIGADSTFEELTEYLPKVLTKISTNLKLYLNDLRDGQSL
jgi:hypothetical protein